MQTKAKKQTSLIQRIISIEIISLFPLGEKYLVHFLKKLNGKLSFFYIKGIFITFVIIVFFLQVQRCGSIVCGRMLWQSVCR